MRSLRLAAWLMALAVLAAPAQAQVSATHSVTLLQTTTIAGAVTGVVTDPIRITTGSHYVVAQATFNYGSGGTTAKAWLQTSVDNGVTWTDVASFAFTTAALKKISSLTTGVALAAAVTPTDGTLADNTIVNGLIGDQLRVKYTTTGTYAGATNLQVVVLVR